MHCHLTCLHLVLKLRMSGVIPLLHQYALMAYVGITMYIIHLFVEQLIMLL
jgi:hypothetical protein